MDIILGIETSTEACSAALYYQGNISAKYKVAPREHASLILEMCDALLKEANITPRQLSAIAFGRGPGSFTGVRIAAAVAQGMAMAHDICVIPISTLQILAQTVYMRCKADKILVGIDARMNEIYFGAFKLRENKMLLQGEEIVAPKQKLPLPSEEGWLSVGSAFQRHEVDYPSAEALLQLAINTKPLPPEAAQPVYLRDNVTF